MLGGDLALQADEPIPAQFLAQASRQGLDTAQTMQFPSMVSGGRASQLVSLKAVSDGYPLRGELRLSDAVAGRAFPAGQSPDARSEEHTSELQSLMRTSYAVFCLKKKQTNNKH